MQFSLLLEMLYLHYLKNLYTGTLALEDKTGSMPIIQSELNKVITLFVSLSEIPRKVKLLLWASE